ncbi:MAG: hypothetical protein ABIX10_00565, partial [Acidimicrobiales bacterium]
TAYHDDPERDREYQQLVRDELLVGAHVLGSVLVWVAALRFHLGLTEPIPVEDPPRHPALLSVDATAPNRHRIGADVPVTS